MIKALMVFAYIASGFIAFTFVVALAVMCIFFWIDLIEGMQEHRRNRSKAERDGTQ